MLCKRNRFQFEIQFVQIANRCFSVYREICSGAKPGGSGRDRGSALRNRKTNNDGGSASLAVRIDFEGASQLPHSLEHATNSEHWSCGLRYDILLIRCTAYAFVRS